MITEDLDIFLNDFGVSVTAGAVSGIGILDMPGESILDDRVISTGYTLVCRSDEFGELGYGASITVDSDAYIVQESMRIADGSFCRLMMERVSGAPPWVPGPGEVEIEINGDFL